MFNEETSKYEGYIYQIYNPFNMKSYIGQTVQTIKMRLAVHKANSKNRISNSPFLYGDAFDYGWDIFDIYEVEKVECDTLDELHNVLNEKEIYYISNYNTLYPDGYNISPGGNFNSINASKEVYQFDLNGDLVAKYDSLTRASQKTGINITMISMCCNGHHATAGNYYWSNSSVLPEDIMQRRLKTRIVQYELDGKFICVFDSIIEAASSISSDANKIYTISSDISKCASLVHKTSRGYIWRYYKDVISPDGEVLQRLPEEDVVRANTIKNKGDANKKSICQYDKSNNYLATYESIKEASEKTGINHCCISACLTNRQQTAGGYIWEYCEER